MLAILRPGFEPRRLAVFSVSLLVVGAGCYGWLRLPDSSGFYLLLQAVLGVMLLAGAGVLVSSTVASLAAVSGREGIGKIWRRAPGGALAVIVTTVLYWLVGQVERAGAKRIYLVASFLSFHFNHPVPIPPFRTAWEILFLFLYLALLPALAIRALARWLRHRSRKGITGETAAPATRDLASEQHVNFLVFWAVAIALAVLFDWLPWKLAWWVPRFHHGWAEVLSAVLRLGTAGLAFTCGLLLQWSWYIGNKPTPAAPSSPSDSGG